MELSLGGRYTGSAELIERLASLKELNARFGMTCTAVSVDEELDGIRVAGVSSYSTSIGTLARTAQTGSGEV